MREHLEKKELDETASRVTQLWGLYEEKSPCAVRKVMPAGEEDSIPGRRIVQKWGVSK